MVSAYSPRLERLDLLLLLWLLAATVVLGAALLGVCRLCHQLLLLLMRSRDDRVHPGQTDRVVLALRSDSSVAVLLIHGSRAAVHRLVGKLLQAASHALIDGRARLGCVLGASAFDDDINAAASAIVRTGQLLLDEATEVGRIAPVFTGVQGGPHRCRHTASSMLVVATYRIACLDKTGAVAGRD